MLTPAEQLRRMGITLEQMEAEAEPSPSRIFTEVEKGPELFRVLRIPRRPIPQQDDPENLELARFLTEKLSTSSELYPGPLRTIQAIALCEAWRAKGGFFPIKVGGGKSLLSFLLPAVIGCTRPLYVCPANMVKDINVEFSKFRRCWVSPVNLPVISYELLSTPNAGEELGDDGKVIRLSKIELMRPNLLIIDECHRLSDSGTTTAKRFAAYLKKCPDTIVVAMSGTPFKTTIKDCSHLMSWALKENAPLPDDFLEREAWASFLDARKGMGPRAGVGALLEFLTPDEKRLHASERDDSELQRTIVRHAIARRLFETPGFVGTQDPPLDVGLTIDVLYPQRTDPAVEQAYEDLKRTMTLPDGSELMDAMQLAARLSTVGMGFWNKWEPEPPTEWREARSTWAKWCRRAIKSNRRGIDSEARMKASVRKGLYDDEGALEAWEQARDAERKRTKLLEPPSVAQWIADEAVDTAVSWIRKHKGVVWVFHIGLGERIAARAGVPYYGAGSVDARGRHIKQHPGGPAVASVTANGTGKNLQGFWSDNLWMCVPNEQNLGRTHRPGQKALVVRNWIYVGCVEHLRSYYAAATQKSKFAEEMLQSPQKIRYAETSMPTMAELTERGPDVRWGAEVEEEER